MMANCPPSLCSLVRCGNNANVTCRINPCGTCEVEFYNATAVQKDCARGLSLCEIQQLRTKRSAKTTWPGRVIPLCNANGSFASVQCYHRTGKCWCVDELGREKNGTRQKGHPNACHSTGMVLTECQSKRLQRLDVREWLLKKADKLRNCSRDEAPNNGTRIRANTKRSGNGTGFIKSSRSKDRLQRASAIRKRANKLHIPTCLPDGSFDEVQCDAQGISCWCVNQKGQRKARTITRGTPVCGASRAANASRAGQCPRVPEGSVSTCAQPCSGNSDCGAPKLCCQMPCGKTCVEPRKKPTPALPTVKPVACPVLPSSNVTCKSSCSSDADCPKSRKCCVLGCRRTCTPPVRPACPKGLDFKMCLYDACASSSCPAYPWARCRMSYCGKCAAEFYHPNGSKADCKIDCPRGRQAMACLLDACKDAWCASRPGAKCVMNPCAGCRPEFYDQNKREVNCSALSTCQTQQHSAIREYRRRYQDRNVGRPPTMRFLVDMFTTGRGTPRGNSGREGQANQGRRGNDDGRNQGESGPVDGTAGRGQGRPANQGRDGQALQGRHGPISHNQGGQDIGRQGGVTNQTQGQGGSANRKQGQGQGGSANQRQGGSANQRQGGSANQRHGQGQGRSANRRQGQGQGGSANQRQGQGQGGSANQRQGIPVNQGRERGTIQRQGQQANQRPWLSSLPDLGVFIPTCSMNGRFEEIQCNQSSGMCWCVDELGQEIEDSQTQGRRPRNCTEKKRSSTGAAEDSRDFRSRSPERGNQDRRDRNSERKKAAQGRNRKRKARLVVHLAGKFAEVKNNLKELEEALLTTLERKYGVERTQVKNIRFSEGSIKVEFEIESSSTGEEVVEVAEMIANEAQAQNFSVEMGGVEYKSNGLVEFTIIQQDEVPQTNGDLLTAAEGIAIGACLTVVLTAAAYLVYKLRSRRKISSSRFAEEDKEKRGAGKADDDIQYVRPGSVVSVVSSATPPPEEVMPKPDGM